MTKSDRLSAGSITLTDYAAAIADTDAIKAGDNHPILMGLFGEVGGIMTTAKKLAREAGAYPGFRRAAEEEFGDTLWYFTRLCERLGVSVSEVFSSATDGAEYSAVPAASDLATGPIAHVSVPVQAPVLDDALFQLGQAASALLENRTADGSTRGRLVAFARNYLAALRASNLKFADVARMNISKARGRFIAADPDKLKNFDERFELEERIPNEFAIRINQRKSGRSYLQWNGVFIGDPLTDNIGDPDGYRFHDVFHLAHAAILHWSPVFRALIKQKRKSHQPTDEAQDGGRAIVIEEGLTAWLFIRAKELNFFEGQTGVSFDILKTIKEFVQGYEVAECPLSLWERAILEGYGVFRQVRAAKGGWVVGDRAKRSITYRPLED